MGIQRLGLGAIAAVVAACAAPSEQGAAAESRGPEERLSVNQVAGFWAVRPVSGPGRCDLSLSNLASGGQYGVLLENCDIADLAGARAWRPTAGGFDLLGAQGAVVIGFRRTGDDGFEAVSGQYRMTRAAMR